RKYQWQPQQKFINQRNDNRPRNNWNNTRQSTAYGQHSGPMDLSMAQKTNNGRNGTQRRDGWKKDKQYYNCNQKGHLAYECKEPKKQKWQPVHERSKQVSMTNKIPHESMSWTGCYDDDCFTHQSDKEASGYYPRDPDCGRTGYDMTIPEIKKKTLAMAYKSNSKMARKTVEQLDEMLRIQQLTFGEGESSPYDSNKSHDVARQHAQAEIAYRFTPSVDNTSSKEESNSKEETQQLLQYQTINITHDEQQRYFYRTPANVRDQDYIPERHIEDHPALRSDHRNHRTLFWPQCFFDKCKEHLGDKHEHQFYPRRHDEHPIRS
ncbi:hypothetical protein K456DRAFT_57100, partial [Colletotrichum gloeosporioides 23]